MSKSPTHSWLLLGGTTSRKSPGSACASFESIDSLPELQIKCPYMVHASHLLFGIHEGRVSPQMPFLQTAFSGLSVYSFVDFSHRCALCEVCFCLLSLKVRLQWAVMNRYSSTTFRSEPSSSKENRTRSRSICFGIV